MDPGSISLDQHQKLMRSVLGRDRPPPEFNRNLFSSFCVFQQLTNKEYFVRQNLLYELQCGFRAAHATETCLIHLFDYIRQNFDEGSFVGMVLLDFQKAFDTVNHEKLLSKLQCLGFSGTEVKRFPTPCGAPQGSILGPLLILPSTFYQ